MPVWVALSSGLRSGPSPRSHGLGDRLAELLRARRAADVGGARDLRSAPSRSRAPRPPRRPCARDARASSAPDQIWPIGLAMFWPKMSGAEPCTGSNIDGYSRSGLRLAEGAMAIVPVQAGPRSERMSPNRLEATTTSNRSGLLDEMRGQDVDVVLVGPDVRVVRRHRLRSARPSTAWRSNMPLDLVAEVTC